MYCYYQDHHARPGGVRFVAPVAVGVCLQCGVAVCAEHAHKDDYAGSPLLCHECAQLQPTNDRSVLQTNGVIQPELS
jgi:hypothetical protein